LRLDFGPYRHNAIGVNYAALPALPEVIDEKFARPHF